jgi:hypothetical protein
LHITTLSSCPQILLLHDKAEEDKKEKEEVTGCA